MVITVYNIKGGVGKSIVAINLAIEFSKRKNKVLLIDADQQATSTNFMQIRSELKVQQFSVNQTLVPTIHKDINKYSDYSPIIIDVGGRDTKIARSAIASSDIIIVPIAPSGSDFWSTEDTFQLIAEIKKHIPELKILGLLNKVMPNTRVAKEVEKLVIEFENDFDMKFIKQRMCSRVSYSYSFDDGLGITEYSNIKAKKEFTNIFNEVYNEFKKKTK